MKLVPSTLREANAFVAKYHRHSRPTQGAKFCLAAEVDGQIVGVCIVGRTLARRLHSRTTAEVTRLCVSPGAPKGACSFLYQAAKRVWQRMGGQRLVTYTLAEESGESLFGAGWVKTAHVKAGEWNVPSRPRGSQPIYGHDKIRWEAA